MDVFIGAATLARLQFSATVAYHFVFVPLTIGLGLILAINETRYYRSRKEEDAAASEFWLKIFAVTFAVGVATGITMEFSFGTNWADYARFVGDIFGAPLAAEALFAFFLESVFLGILLFGRKRVSPKFYLVSAWLVWFGSCLSSLWILIANSWMQTPAGAVLSADGTKAVLSDFLAAAANPSLVPRYLHTTLALIVMGAFVAMSVAAWYLLKGRHADFAMKTMKIGAVVGMISTVALFGSAHASAFLVTQEQPTKLAMMEGMYNTQAAPLYLVGWVDEQNQEVIAPFSIPGGTSFLATGTWDAQFQGLNDLAKNPRYAALDPLSAPSNFVFQTYHTMVFMFGLILLTVILALVFTMRGGKIKHMKWLQRLLVVSPIFPFLAIQMGWFSAEVGRQPWVVYPATCAPDGISLLTNSAISKSVSNVELAITLVLFLVMYTLIALAWIRIVSHFIKEGPRSVSGVSQSDAGDIQKEICNTSLKADMNTLVSAQAKEGE